MANKCLLWVARGTFAVFLLARPCLAQDVTPTAVTTQNRGGDLPFSSTIGTDIERVDVSSGNLIVTIPITSVPGRGMNLGFGLRYDARFLVVKTFANPPAELWRGEGYGAWLGTNQSIHPIGWTTNESQLTYAYVTYSCSDGVTTPWYDTFYIFRDSTGVKHPLAYQWGHRMCDGGSARDVFEPDLAGEGMWISLPGTFVTYSNGTVGHGFGAVAWTDANGNQKADGPGATDTLGRVPLTQQVSSNQILYRVRDSNGALQTTTVNFTNINIATNFNIIDGGYIRIGEWSAQLQSVSSIVLPNGRSYQFTYDSYGGITQITLPTGGYNTYTWATLADGPRTFRYVASRTVHVSGQSYTWNFSLTGTCGIFTNMVTDPQGNQSVYNTRLGVVMSAAIYNGTASGNPVRQYAVLYGSDQDPQDGERGASLCDVGLIALRPTQVTTTLDNNLVSKKEFDYDTLNYTYHDAPGSSVASPFTTTRGNVLEIREYDWGSGAPGPLIRRTDKTYLHDSNSNYLGSNIVDKVLQETTYDGAGNQVAQTQYEYDTYVPGVNAMVSTSGAPQHDYTNYPSSFIYRGNATRVKRWRNTDGALVTTIYTYDDLGNIRAIQDPNTITTNYSYNDNWANSYCRPPANSLAYVTQMTNPLSQNVKVSYYPCTGLRQALQNQNDINASRPGTTSTYDFFGRVLSTNFPDGGQTTSSYNDTPPVTVATTTKITGSLNTVATTIQDGLARITETQLNSDPDGATYVDTTYDAFGRKATVSNPYRTSNDPGPTNGITTSNYDVLGRVTKLIPPDGTTSTDNVTTAYAGNCTTVTDQATKIRKSCTDGLGHLTQVFEPDSSIW
jgi:YD repeat-containing protein